MRTFSFCSLELRGLLLPGTSILYSSASSATFRANSCHLSESVKMGYVRFLPFCFQGILSFNTIRTVSVYQGESLWKNTHLDMTAKTNCSTKEFTPEIVGKCHFHRQYHNNNTSPKNSGWWEKNWEISDWNRDKCTEYHILKLQNYYQKSGACFMKEYI